VIAAVAELLEQAGPSSSISSGQAGQGTLKGKEDLMVHIGTTAFAEQEPFPILKKGR